ncbi:MAG: hypothetical protein J7K46_03870 [Bacteroidales bacterium]|nr:hypothetical protein [Bacteroidales bacterium]
MNRRLFFAGAGLFLLFSLLSCKKSPDGPSDIRIRNKSGVLFKNVHVDTSGGEHNYGEVNPGGVTDYYRFDIAYREAHITLDINDVQYELVPVAYTYEVPLGQGKFTYELSIADTISHLLAIHVIPDAPLK